jgi:hypothetical protein
MNENVERIKRVSKSFRIVFMSGFWLIPALLILFWANINWLIPYVPPMFPIEPEVPLSILVLVLGFCVSMITGGLSMIIALKLARLFQLYEQGKIFTIQHVTLFKHLGLLLLSLVPARVISQSLFSIVLSFETQQGKVTVSFSSDEVTSLLIGGVVLLISWVMEEAQQLQNDHDLTI